MTLLEKLDEIKAEFKEKADPESLALMDRATRELEESGIQEQAIGSGERMPDFTLEAAQGGTVASQDMLTQGPLVVTFYRGVW